MKYKTGNLFDSDAQALAHGVNTVGVMGAGIAVEFKRRYPDMFETYQLLCDNNVLTPGWLYTFPTDDGRFVYNIASQDKPGKYARIEWIEHSLTLVCSHAIVHDVDRIAIPCIGCGLGGLKWEEVEAVFQSFESESLEFEVWVL